MEKINYLTISEFSKISEVSRKALIFYDNAGLFSPEYTGENGYRYYSHEQIYIISVINILSKREYISESDMPTAAILQGKSCCMPNAIGKEKSPTSSCSDNGHDKRQNRCHRDNPYCLITFL